MKINKTNTSEVSLNSVFFTLLISALACFTLFVSLQTVVNGYSSIMGYSFFRVATGSMEPTIATGSIIICKEESIDNIKRGDIICFRSKSNAMLGAIITHRVIEITNIDEKKCLETRGDNNNASDAYYVEDDNLVGKVVYYRGVDKLNSTFLRLLNSKIGFFAFVLLPVLIIGGFVLKNSVENLSISIKNEKEKYEIMIKENIELNKQLDGYETLTQADYLEIYEKLKEELENESEQKQEKE